VFRDEGNIFAGHVELHGGKFVAILFDDSRLGYFRTLHTAMTAVRMLAQLKDDEPLE
jgi:hypothetical protein